MLVTIFITVGLCLLLQISLWAHAVRKQNAGWVDFGWAAGMALSALVILTRNYAEPRAWLACLLLFGWAARLASHILVDRLLQDKPEDSRYQALRERWGKNANLHFLWFFSAQALLVGIFMLPALVVANRAGPFPDVLDVIGFLVALMAVAGESWSDRQLAAFRADPTTKGQVCKRGFWKYSRHPNYFFEWMHWLGYVIMALGAPTWLLTWVGPVFMYIFLRYITGVPHAERQSLKSRGEAYRKYQQTTSVFFPWKPHAS